MANILQTLKLIFQNIFLMRCFQDRGTDPPHNSTAKGEEENKGEIWKGGKVLNSFDI